MLCCKSEGSADGTKAHGAVEAVGNTGGSLQHEKTLLPSKN